MNAYFLHGARDLRLQTVLSPEPGPDDVAIDVRRVGVCGSDMEYYAHGYCGDFRPSAPFVLGHELMGRVADVGRNVRDLVVGTRVAVDPAVTCGRCPRCREGRINLCQNVTFLGSASVTPHVDGGLRERIVMPMANCYALPDRVGDAEAALLEPTSVALHAIERAGPIVGRRVLVAGGGTIGQLVTMLARRVGATYVAVSDPRQHRREQAVALAADAAFDPVDAGLVQASGAAFDIVFEASGAAAALAQAIDLARKGGTVVQIGTLPERVELPANRIMSKELQLLGSFRFTTDFARAMALVADGSIDVQRIVTATFPFEQTAAAFDAAVNDEANLKVQVVLPGGKVDAS